MVDVVWMAALPYAAYVLWDTPEQHALSGSFDKLDLSTNLFIGGVPAKNSFSCYQLLGYTGFVGCIRLIKLNNKAIDLYYKRNSINIVSGLDISK
ncbi:hypothetical protein EB796_019192 [Bugula neritina]|uniref:Laminin G domain-containing protein n=1 Tax=Bugula neritina TaxID=10212 RepID=A0A7J7JAU7_BUGNE|nr:hypothetical protein EB796_019192 [Bugula neritina]